MIRDVDLLSYLPSFMTKFKEIAATLDAENPEFVLVWKAADRVLQNEFIETADEYGISRFEEILNILPSKEDTLESRRSRVFSRWFNTISYTLKALIAKLEALCGDSDFTIIKGYDNYTITIIVDLKMFGQVDELDHIIESMIPCNMIVNSQNKIPCEASGLALSGGGICSVQDFFVTNDFRESYTTNSEATFGGGVVNTAAVVITNDFNEWFSINGENNAGSGVTVSEFIGTNQ
jgi:hypothetical protein